MLKNRTIYSAIWRLFLFFVSLPSNFFSRIWLIIFLSIETLDFKCLYLNYFLFCLLTKQILQNKCSSPVAFMNRRGMVNVFIFCLIDSLSVFWGGSCSVLYKKNCSKKVNMSYSRAGRQLGQEFSLLKIKFSFILYAL